MSDLIIYYGFQSIFSNNTYNKDKALNLVKSGHVTHVKEVKTIQGPCLISGQVIGQASVTLAPYNVKIELCDSRLIQSASCECAAGTSEKCKHIGALFYYINNEQTLSKTKKAKKISDLFPPKKTRLDVATVDTNYFIKNTNLLLLHCPLSYNMKVETQKQEESVCEEVLKCIINNVEETMNLDFYNSYMNTIITKQKLFKNNCYLGNQTCYFPLDFKLTEFFFKHIVVSEENMKYIFNKTLDQSGKFWLDNRKVRISASNKAHKIKTSKTLSDEKQQALAKSLFSSKPLIGKAAINATYGTQTENEAFVAYCKMVNLPVIKCGLVIHLEKPWLCATPDGIVIVNDKPEKVLEIKCPISCKDKEIIDPLTNIPNINYLKVIDGKVCLKESHMYYTQCQVGTDVHYRTEFM